ncbi:hypothetical protein K445DRAFT_21401 [Daldinia sp. EC12]|nr:hypothetical protein K445DRAFT_21401 [Daldinia sp. EC12]
MGDQDPTLNVDYHQQEYQSFVKKLRSTFGQPGSFIRNIPVLPPQSQTFIFIDVVLRAEPHRLRLRVRRDNLYLIGFRNNVKGSQWFEFDGAYSQHLIPGSEFLGFDGSYGSLELAGRLRQNLPLGQQPLQVAVHTLTTLTKRPTKENKKKVAESLLVVIQMICESVRFERISDYLTQNWTSSLNPPGQIIDIQTSWGTLSEALIHVEQDPTHFRLGRNNLGFTDAGSVAVALGCLLHRSLPKSPRLFSAIMSTPWGDYPRGRTLAEVFWVRIENIDNKNQGQLYGTIKATDALGTQYIYNRDKVNHESIGPQGYISLAGPEQSILATDSFTINLDLWNHNDSSQDHQVVNDRIAWDPYYTTSIFDQLLTRRVNGDNGWATVQYIVMSNAAQALVEVILNNGDGEDPANVYGNITANNGVGNITLFDKAANNPVDVHQKAAIPLVRTTMAVPLDEYLTINATLHSHNGSSPDVEIANGNRRFNVDISASSSATISGKDGEISVKVTWF